IIKKYKTLVNALQELENWILLYIEVILIDEIIHKCYLHIQPTKTFDNLPNTIKSKG
ncbi:9366_t:CDS:2, partial [Funneliformis geosporum]